MENKETCKWTPMKRFIYGYNTSCYRGYLDETDWGNNATIFEVFDFCPYCGKPIEEVKDD